jgi:hypothetical protein
MRPISTGAICTPIRKCPGTQHVGSNKYCSYIPYEMFNLQAGVLEKSKSCFRVQKFTKAAPQTEKPCRFPIDESDSVYVFINKCRPTYLCQKQTLRSSTTYSATHTHTHTDEHPSWKPIGPSHSTLHDCQGLSWVCFHHFDQNNRTCEITDL